jgi:hypothetical protein
MPHNMGAMDRILRGFLVAPAATVAALSIGLPSAGGVALLVLASVMVATSATGVCPLYRPFGLDTHRRGVHGPV